MPSTHYLFCLVVGTAVLSPLPPALAQEVQWRHDYDKARREAADKGLPLVIDFGTDNCAYCKKLDAGTFCHPAVVQLLNERFIPLKVDANKDNALTQALNIRLFPTIVLGACNGVILDFHAGYLEADRFQELLHRNLAKLADQEWMVRDYEAAAQAAAAAEFPKAVALLKAVLEDNRGRPVQVKARQLLLDLEQQALGRLARARQAADQGRDAEAMEAVSETVRLFS